MVWELVRPTLGQGVEDLDVLRKSYQLTTAIPPEEVLDRVCRLLQAECVEIRRDGGQVRSSSTPFALWNFDRRKYSRRNWVGINPFMYLSSIVVTARRGADGTLVDVAIDRRRMVILAAAQAAVLLVIASAAPLLAVAVAAAVVFGAWSVLLRWSYTLTRSEICRELALRP